MADLKKVISIASFNFSALRFSFDEPFTWSSGFRMPMYFVL